MMLGKGFLCGLLLLVLITFSSGCVAVNGKPFRLMPQPSSCGDGKYQDISWLFPRPDFPIGLPVLGYRVNFPAFNLDNTYEQVYVVENLPNYHTDVHVLLLVNAPDGFRPDEDKQRLQADIEYEICDAKGQVLVHARESLAEMQWTGKSNFGPYTHGYELKIPGGTSFPYRRWKRYTLRVKYRPDQALRGGEGLNYLEWGGYI